MTKNFNFFAIMIFSCSLTTGVGCAHQPPSASTKSSASASKTDFAKLLSQRPTAAGTSAQVQYKFVTLNIPNGAVASRINDNGSIVGFSFVESGWYYGCTTAYLPKPYIYKNGALTILGTPSQAICMSPIAGEIDVNNSDVVVGTLNGHAYKWQSGAFSDLHNTIQGALGTLNGTGARAISNTGLIAGYSNDGYNTDAVMFNGSQWIKLLDGEMPMLIPHATAINDSGFGIVDRAGYRGIQAFSTMQNGVLSQPQGFPTDVPAYYYYASAVNNQGRFVGEYGSEYGAYVHNGSTPTPLGQYNAAGEYNTAENVTPRAINDSGLIVGSTSISGVAVMYENGGWIDLNSRVTGIPAGWKLISAQDVNNSGAIVGTALDANSNIYRAFLATPVPEVNTVYARGTFNGWSSTAMTKTTDGSFELTTNVPTDTNPRFKFDVKGDWSENYGDNNGDNYADLAATKDIPFSGGAGSYKVTFNYATKYYSVTKQSTGPGEDWRRTVVFIFGITQPGQDMFIRGGIDHAYAQSALGKSCTAANKLCAVPIQHRLFTTDAKRANDKYLDWYGAETGQGVVEGSPLTWTTDVWPATWGAAKTVALNGYGVEPLNAFGQHYWMLDVLMDCSKSVNGWVELKSYISNGPGWEGNIAQANTPYTSANHFAKCGMLNKFERGSNAALIQPLP